MKKWWYVRGETAEGEPFTAEWYTEAESIKASAQGFADKGCTNVFVFEDSGRPRADLSPFVPRQD